MAEEPNQQIEHTTLSTSFIHSFMLRGVSFWSLGPVWLLCNEGPFRLWVHQHGMTSPLSCVPCWWPTLPNFTSLLSSSILSVTGLGAPLSSSLLKRRYISLQNEWMNKRNINRSGVVVIKQEVRECLWEVGDRLWELGELRHEWCLLHIALLHEQKLNTWKKSGTSPHVPAHCTIYRSPSNTTT